MHTAKFGCHASAPGFAEGAWSVQDVGAQCVALLADPTPAGTHSDPSSAPTAGDGRPPVVLDLCSAPGGKALAPGVSAMSVSGQIVTHFLALHCIRNPNTKMKTHF